MQNTHCNTLQHTAIHCNALQCTAIHCIIVDLTAKSDSLDYNKQCITMQHTATHCNTLQHTATHCNIMQHTASYCRKLQHAATHCNTLQHTAINRPESLARTHPHPFDAHSQNNTPLLSNPPTRAPTYFSPTALHPHMSPRISRRARVPPLDEQGTRASILLREATAKRENERQEIRALLQTPRERWSENDRNRESQRRGLSERGYVQHDHGMQEVDTSKIFEESNHVGA